MIELSKDFAARLLQMIDSKLIDYTYYIPWCDDVMEKLDTPPYCVIELSVEKQRFKAIKLLGEYVFSQPFLDYEHLDLEDFYIACMFIRWRNKKIIWAEFLRLSGWYSDGHDGSSLDCEYFYHMLNQFESSENPDKLEKEQAEVISKEFSQQIGLAFEYYDLYKAHLHHSITDFQKKFEDAFKQKFTSFLPSYLAQANGEKIYSIAFSTDDF